LARFQLFVEEEYWSIMGQVVCSRNLDAPVNPGQTNVVVPAGAVVDTACPTVTDSTAVSGADQKSIASPAPATPTGLKKEAAQLAVPKYPVSIDGAVFSVQEKRRVLLVKATTTDEKEALLRVASMWTNVLAQTPAGLLKLLPHDARQIHEQEHYYKMLEIVVQKRLASDRKSRCALEPKYAVAGARRTFVMRDSSR
jgi:hypothetical protein